MEKNLNKAHILVVDDEEDITDILQFNLENEGYEVSTAHSAEEALEMMDNSFDLLLLDVMMEGMSGFKMADKLRKQQILTPIIFLTAKDTENDMLTGFSIGGDDYMTKPFSIKELIARVKSVLKRTYHADAQKKNDLVEVMGISIDTTKKSVTVDGEKIELTKTELGILLLLLENLGQVFSRTDILDKVWKEDGIVLERTVDVHIARLRKKLGKYGVNIVNKTGYGYTFDA